MSVLYVAAARDGVSGLEGEQRRRLGSWRSSRMNVLVTLRLLKVILLVALLVIFRLRPC